MFTITKKQEKMGKITKVNEVDKQIFKKQI